MARLGILEWILAGLLSLWASIGLAVDLLMCMMAIDFATGMLCAARNGTLSSHVSWRGLMRKSAILIVVGVTHLLQKAIEMGQNIHLLIDLAQTVSLAYCWSEVLSILENCACMGAPIPGLLRKILLAAPKMESIDEEDTLS